MDSRAGGSSTPGRGVRPNNDTSGSNGGTRPAHGGACGEANNRTSRGADHSTGSTGSRADHGPQAS
jgi:hypothetical protein